MAEHKKTISAICWCPEKPDYLASSSLDGLLVVWDVAKQQVVAKYVCKDPVMHIGWTLNKRQCLAFMNKSGPLWLWYIQDGKNLSMVKETQNFSSHVTTFRWHHEKHNCIAFGHGDGSISVLDIDLEKYTGNKAHKHVFKPDASASLSGDIDESDDPVMTLEWDPLSQDYLLVCNQAAGVRLVDVPGQRVIMFFALPSAASRVQTMSWIHNAPGMFVTGDCMGGILRVWNVSKSTPIQNMKIKRTGFHRLEVIHMTGSNNRSDENLKDSVTGEIKNNHHISSTSESRSPPVTTLSRFTLPHAQVVCTFRDGGVGLYDLGRKKWTFLRDQGHIETIFDCKFEPDNPDHLATASFDGTIKIWDIPSMTCLKSSPGNEGIIYHISWAPADLNCIAACTARQGAFIWDVQKDKIIKRLSNHSPKTAVFCIAWNQTDSKSIMTCGKDGYCIVQQVDGTVIQKYKHPAAVFGCDWSPFNKDMLATGCEDKSVRVFYMASSTDHPIKVFSGHESKVFHIRWNPLKEGVLCSGSDDGHIRVWDYTRDQCICVLTGHSAPVRGLTWNAEVPTLLASGSWDFTIRLWDTRDGACLYTAFDHGGDVYGLTSHPSRPFLLASSSRDSTVRLWSITSLVQPVELSILANKHPSELSGSGEPAQTAASSYILCGRAWKDLSSINSRRSSTLESYSKFFSHPCGTANLWDLVSVFQGRDVMMLSPAYSSGIVHQKHVIKFKGSETQQLEMIKMSRFGGGIGAPSREERLRQAAKIYIQLGNVKRYCELMVELGEWVKALALAPSVSMEYWKKLNQRYCSVLLQEDNDDVVPHSVAAGSVAQLVTFYTSRGQLIDAATVAQSAAEGCITEVRARTEEADMKSSSERDALEQDGARLNVEAMEDLANYYFRNGSPTLAACCHLAVDDPSKAIAKLIRGHELELAVSIGQVLGNCPNETDVAIGFLSRRCEALGKWELGVDLLRLQQNPKQALASLCARCSASMAEIDTLLHKAGLPSMEACYRKAVSLEQSSDTLEECIQYYLLSSAPERGLELGLEHIKETMQTGHWVVDDVFPMLQLLGSIRTDKLQHSKSVKTMYELLALSAYVGALVAVRRQFYSVVQPLLLHARELLGKERMRLPISVAQIEEELSLLTSMISN
ncbi:WD repeat-containing protein 17, partial [Plakobranchus ocellatus]